MVLRVSTATHATFTSHVHRTYFQDLQGNTRVLISTSGRMTANYPPYGVVDESGSFVLGYPGGYSDIFTGLVFDEARWYDPSTGQFLSTDPAATQTLQPFAYANDNPTSEEDPSGTAPLSRGRFRKACKWLADRVRPGVEAGACDAFGVRGGACFQLLYLRGTFENSAAFLYAAVCTAVLTSYRFTVETWNSPGTKRTEWREYKGDVHSPGLARSDLLPRQAEEAGSFHASESDLRSAGVRSVVVTPISIGPRLVETVAGCTFMYHPCVAWAKSSKVVADGQYDGSKLLTPVINVFGNNVSDLMKSNNFELFNTEGVQEGVIDPIAEALAP